jgi:DNA-binding NarL/FixJ family response regulator
MTAGPTVLVADDEPATAQLIRRTLERGDYQVVAEVEDLDHLPAAIRRYRPHIATLDLRFGERNALELLPELRREFPGTRILVVSGYPEFLEGAIARGASGFLTKPFDVHALLGAIWLISIGGIYFPTDGGTATGPILVRPQRPLTRRQLEMFRFRQSGLTLHAIAARRRKGIKAMERLWARTRGALGLERFGVGLDIRRVVLVDQHSAAGGHGRPLQKS